MKLFESKLSRLKFSRYVQILGCLMLTLGQAWGDTGMKIKANVEGLDSSKKFIDVIFTRPLNAPPRVYGVEALVLKKGEPAILRRYAICMGAGTFHMAFGDDSHCFSQTVGPNASADGWYVRVMRMGKPIALEGSLQELSKKTPAWTPVAPYQRLWAPASNELPATEARCQECNGFGKVTGKPNNKVKADRTNKEPCPICRGTGNARILDWTGLHRELTLRDVEYLTKTAAERKALDDKDAQLLGEILKAED